MYRAACRTWRRWTQAPQAPSQAGANDGGGERYTPRAQLSSAPPAGDPLDQTLTAANGGSPDLASQVGSQNVRGRVEITKRQLVATPGGDEENGNERAQGLPCLRQLTPWLTPLPLHIIMAARLVPSVVLDRSSLRSGNLYRTGH